MTHVSLAGLTLADPDGEPVALADLIGPEGDPPRWLVIQAIRYYG